MTGLIVVDGYNLIHEVPALEELARSDMEGARQALIHLLAEYGAREGREIEVVFDAGGREGPETREDRSESIRVTFTGGGRTADDYIEKKAYALRGRGRGETVFVTGDYHQQKVIYGAGFTRMSSREFAGEVEESRRRALEEGTGSRRGRRKVTISERIPDDVRAALKRFGRHRH